MFETVLIANRGEIAVRIARTLRRLGVRSVAVYTEPDAGAPHVRAADLAVPLGHPRAYLDAGRVLDAAARTGAQAVHPGYGFLSENAAFAAACADAGLAFVGPPAAAIEAMGDKISAKTVAENAGVPVVPGRHEPGLSDADLAAAAGEIGFPVLLKPAAGGGGKGMRRVDAPDLLAGQIAAARREATSAFGDATLLVERYVRGPRHVEVQVLADRHGAVVHLGERECSLQRRHQKIIEEAPSPLVGDRLRERLGGWAVTVARAVGYVGAGTVEFVVGGGGREAYFIEMNTRLQVEHPVTELVTGLDLVELQLRVAAGEPLPFGQDGVHLSGHAVEARIYAEDPARGFLPTGGRVLRLREPDLPGVRVDSALAEGLVVGSHYDPMLAKVACWAPDRPAALALARGALATTAVLGVTTNVAFLRGLLADPDVARGELSTDLVETRTDLLAEPPVPDEVYAAAALAKLLAMEPAGPAVDPFDVPSGWRLGEPAWTVWPMAALTGAGPASGSAAEPVDVGVQGRPAAARVRLGGAPPVPASAAWDGPTLVVTVAGCTHRFAHAVDGPVHWLGRDGRAWALREAERLRAAGAEQAAAGTLRAPMPGTVTVVNVAAGDRVTAGQPLLVVEAMKMEHVIAAPVDGSVAELLVRPGSAVALDDPLAVVAGEEG